MPESGRSHTDDNGGDGAGEKPQAAETRHKRWKLHRPPPSFAPAQRPGVCASLKAGPLSLSHRCFWSNVPWSFREGGQDRRLSSCVASWEANVMNVGGGGAGEQQETPWQRRRLGLLLISAVRNIREPDSGAGADAAFAQQNCRWQKPAGNGEMARAQPRPNTGKAS